MTPEQQVYENAVVEVAEKLGLPVSVVNKTYKAFWKFVRESLASLPMKQDLTEEEFNALRTSVNIPSLGKFSCDYDRFKRIKKRMEYIQQIRENDTKEN